MNITPPELKAHLEKGHLEKAHDLRLIDVREPEEWALGHIAGAELMPLSQFEQTAPEKLSPEDEIVVYCHHGVRSARAQEFLKSRGYKNVLNLSGGIEAWSLQVDPAVPRY
jgi:rhodanese-related sulfurtransferase